MKFSLPGIFCLTLLFALSTSEAAPSLPSGPPSPTKIEGYCGENGGTYWPPGPESSTYGCLLPDGSVVICGGSGTGCDTISAAGGLPPSKLPLAGIDLLMAVDTRTRLDQMQDKLGLLEGMIVDLGVLVEDQCEPPIFVP